VNRTASLVHLVVCAAGAWQRLNAHNSWGTSWRDNSSTTTGDHGRITARSWFPDVTTGSAELIDEFVQVASRG